MHLLKGIVIAFSMYSGIPMPATEWKEEDMRYALCFFPLVGAVIGGLCYVWLRICEAAGIGSLARSCVCAALPLLIVGGIHMDGYMDTMDALHSHRGKERRLEILKDSHIGAFAVIMTVIFELLYGSAISEIAGWKMTAVFCTGFFLSRCMSGIALLTIGNARGDGTAYQFAGSAAAGRVRVVLFTMTAAALLFTAMIYPWAGAAAALISFGGYFLFRRMALKDFGGITGDLLGFYLILTELFFAILPAVFSLVLMRG